MRSRVYIDTHLYLFSDDEWEGNLFVDKLSALTDLLLAVGSLDDRLAGALPPIMFEATDNLQELVFSTNPFINYPDRSFYHAQYNRSVLPEILRRFQSCPKADCSQGPCPAALVIARSVDDPRDPPFADHVNLCLECSSKLPMRLIRYAADTAIDGQDEAFDRIIRLPDESPLRILTAGSLLPLEKGHRDRGLLNLAVEAFLAEESAHEKAWALPIRALRPTDNFWRSLHAADFGDSADLYAWRILRSLAQLAIGVDFDINAHGMTSKTFSLDGSSIGMWNAYVFRSGASDQDRRCSRIYYGYQDNSIVLHEYEPDAH